MARCGGPIRSATRPLLHSSILFRPHQQRRKNAPPLVVEAPGYCPPGPKCLFHQILYRHSQLPGVPKIGDDIRSDKALTNLRGERNRYGCGRVLTVYPPCPNGVGANLTRGILMKKLPFAIVGAAALALAACGGQGDDALGDNVEDNYDAAADNLEAMADNASTEAEADALENQADALEAEGDAKEEAIDEADVKAGNVTAM